MEEPPSSRAVRIVEEAARAGGLSIVVVHHADTTRTAEDAAAAVGCDVGQIVKSLVFSVRAASGGVGDRPDGGTPDGGQGGGAEGEPVLALVSGRNQLDERRLADRVRVVTGFAIGGVPPFGHLTPLRCFVDRDLHGYDVVWAAAGTPHAVFAAAPGELSRVAGGQVAELRRG